MISTIMRELKNNISIQAIIISFVHRRRCMSRLNTIFQRNTRFLLRLYHIHMSSHNSLSMMSWLLHKFLLTMLPKVMCLYTLLNMEVQVLNHRPSLFQCNSSFSPILHKSIVYSLLQCLHMLLMPIMIITIIQSTMELQYNNLLPTDIINILHLYSNQLSHKKDQSMIRRLLQRLKMSVLPSNSQHMILSS